jgi:hypothetical protein
MPRRAIKPTKNTAKLGKEIMTPLDRIPNLAYSGLSFAALRGLQAKPHSFCPFLRGAIAIRPVSLHTGEVSRIMTGLR